MEKAEALKCSGNALFSQGKIDMSIMCYEQGVRLLDALSSSNQTPASEQDREKFRLLQSVLLSNLSQALFSAGRFADSALAAQRSMSCDANNPKICFRLVRALHAIGRTFEAFVLILQSLKPLVPTAKELSLMMGGLDDQIYAALGITDLAIDLFGVQQMSNGLTGFARKRITSGALLFTEKKLTLSRIDPMLATSAPGTPVTNEKLISNFGAQLRAVQCDKTPEGVGHWKTICNEMAGSWPRRLDDVPQDLLDEGKKILLPLVGNINEPELTELLLLTLVCRYNCFHFGFFRTSALVNHSCNPNIAMKQTKEGNVAMVAVRDIAAGETLSVKYLGDTDYMMGICQRRELLYQSWLFRCDCERCGLDEQPSSQCEHVRCDTCAKAGVESYVYLPVPSSLALTDLALVPAPVMPCATCRRVPQLTEALVDLVAELRSAPVEWTTGASSFHVMTLSYAQLRQRALQHLNNEHWVFRYMLCYLLICTQSPITQSVMLMARKEFRASDCAREFLRSFGWGDSIIDERYTSPNLQLTNGGGGHLLQATLDFARRIEPFYPPRQAWTLHVTICRLVLYSLINPDHAMALPLDVCVALVREHGQYIGANESQAFHIILKANAPNLNLSTKVVKDLKAATFENLDGTLAKLDLR